MVRRSRLLVLVVITALATLGAPLPVGARPRFPDTVERTIAVAAGARLSPTEARGAFLERGVTKLPLRANLVAVSFAAAPGGDLDAIHVEARFRTEGGWSGWESLEIEHDAGPEADEARGASGRIFAGPLWVGTAEEMNLRVLAHPGAPEASDVRAHLINTKGDSEKPNLLQRLTGAASRILRGSPAEAVTVTPRIVTRAQWGADESWRECCPRYGTVNMAFVHHTAGTNNYSASESAAVVRSVYKFHTSNRGWSDIGYNFLVDRYGQVFEGRYGGMTSPVIGAHVKAFNAQSTGISLMGTFSDSSPPAAMVASLQRLLAWKLDVHHVPPVGSVTLVTGAGGNERYTQGTPVRFNRISGHRDGQSTSCPGSRTYALLGSIRSNVETIGLPKLYLPTASTPVVRPDGDGVNETTTIRASFTTTVNWTLDIRDAEGVSTLRRTTGRGSTLSAAWDGRVASGELGRSGPVQYVIDARDDAGRPVRTAAGPLWLAANHPDGTLLRSSTQTVWIEGGARRAVGSTAIRDSWFRGNEDVAATDAEIARYPAGAALLPREGTIYETPDGDFWIFSGGAMRRFASASVLLSLGWTASSALPITAGEAAALPAGPPVADATVHPAGSAVSAPDGSVWVIAAGARRPVPTDVVRRSWYRDGEVVPATAGDLALAQGTPVTYREGTLFRLDDGSLWIYTDGVRRGFDATLFVAMGYAEPAALALSDAEAATIPAAYFGRYPPAGISVPGDWDGDDDDTPAAVIGATWYANDGLDDTIDRTVTFGRAGDRPVAGDWNGDGADSPGLIRGATWYLNDGFDGAAERAFTFGRSTDVPVAGDWDGDGDVTPGVVRGATWYLNNGFDGTPEIVFTFGRAGDRPAVGDWNGDGRDTPGVVRGNAWYLNDWFDGAPEIVFSFGRSTDPIVTGDWNGDGRDTPGVVRGPVWYLNDWFDGEADVVYPVQS